MTTIKIADYHSYRDYIRDFVREQKQLNPRFSYRRMSKLAGVSTPGFFQEVAVGKRNISVEMIPRVAKIFSLNEMESRYFEHLVRQESNQIKADDHRSLVIQATRGRLLAEEKARVFHSDSLDWYLPLLILLRNATDYRDDPQWVLEKLGGSLTLSQVRMGMVAVERLFRRGTAPMDTNVLACIKQRPELPIVHQSLLAHWARASKGWQAPDASAGILTVKISKEMRQIISDRIEDFVYELISLVQSGDSENQGEEAKENGSQEEEYVQIGIFCLPYK